MANRSESAAWVGGVVFAAGVLASQWEQDEIAEELLEHIGVSSVSQLRRIGVPSVDIDNVKRLLPALRRKLKR